jgi:hypothetical protein
MMCCKLPDIEAFEKPAGVWCRHAKAGQGCSIYEDRPSVCRNFLCEWMTDMFLGEEWKPTVAKFLVFTNAIDKSLSILPDTGYPNSWRQEPYYSALKKTAARLIEQKRMTRVIVGQKTVVLLPDRDEVVHTKPDSKLSVVTTHSSAGPKYTVNVY